MPEQEQFNFANIFNENKKAEMRSYYESRVHMPDASLETQVDKSVLTLRVKSLSKLGMYICRYVRLFDVENANFAHRLFAINIKSTIYLLRTQSGVYTKEDADNICSDLETMQEAMFVILTINLETRSHLDDIYAVFYDALFNVNSRYCVLKN